MSREYAQPGTRVVSADVVPDPGQVVVSRDDGHAVANVPPAVADNMAILQAQSVAMVQATAAVLQDKHDVRFKVDHETSLSVNGVTLSARASQVGEGTRHGSAGPARQVSFPSQLVGTAAVFVVVVGLLFGLATLFGGKDEPRHEYLPDWRELPYAPSGKQ